MPRNKAVSLLLSLISLALGATAGIAQTQEWERYMEGATALQMLGRGAQAHELYARAKAITDGRAEGNQEN